MAQSPRSTPSSAGFSDDPLENLTDWLHQNGRTVTMVVVGAALIAAGTFGYRSWTSAVNSKASTALYAAKEPMLAGKLPEAKTALERVVKSYGSTTAGQQAAMLLAQVLYDQAQYQAGIDALGKAISSASKASAPSFEALIAAGYEGLNDPTKAAEHYSKASELAIFPSDKGQYRTSQARMLMSAGKLDEAKKIFNDLVLDEASVYGQEARVRLGEIEASR